MTDEVIAGNEYDNINAEPGRESVKKAEFEPFGEHGGEKPEGHNNIDLLLDVPLPVSVELGRATMTIRDILDLGAGSVVEVDRVAGEPVDILVNGRLVARGEVVVIDENFGVRILDMVSPEERLTDGD
ncbi:MAG: flagellar motor switch protein FliN [Firmicutes bacterium]|jgi:flagellar motor switch protein FliN/FliY|nr:flagellar motor switch protein FliN [Bacillota bacterium]